MIPYYRLHLSAEVRMFFKITVATAFITAVTSLPSNAQSAADAVALVTWGASPSKYYRLLKRTPSSVEYRSLSDSSPQELKVEQLSPCKFTISFREIKYSGAYTGTLDYTAPQWSHLMKTRMKMIDGSLGFEIVHVPGARYCHTSGFSPLDYGVMPGACREFSAFIPESNTANGINTLKRFCPGGNAVTSAGVSTPTAPPSPTARSIPGQWAFAPDSETSSKLAWQYTPGQSEFLAIVISCDATKKAATVSLDLSVETQAKPSQRVSAKVTKGNATLIVTGKVANGESGLFVGSAATYLQVAQLLDQPGDLVVALTHHRLSFSEKTLAGPSAAFTRTCQLRHAL